MVRIITISILLILITSPVHARGGGPSNNSRVTATSSTFKPAKASPPPATIKKYSGPSPSKAGNVKSDQNKIGQTKGAQEKNVTAKGTAVGEGSLEYTIGVFGKLQSGDHQQQLKQMENNLQQLKTEKRVNRVKRCIDC